MIIDIRDITALTEGMRIAAEDDATLNMGRLRLLPDSLSPLLLSAMSHKATETRTENLPMTII